MGREHSSCHLAPCTPAIFTAHAESMLRDTSPSYADVKVYNGNEILFRSIFRGYRSDKDSTVQQKFADELFVLEANQGSCIPSMKAGQADDDESQVGCLVIFAEDLDQGNRSKLTEREGGIVPTRATGFLTSEAWLSGQAEVSGAPSSTHGEGTLVSVNKQMDCRWGLGSTSDRSKFVTPIKARECMRSMRTVIAPGWVEGLQDPHPGSPPRSLQRRWPT